MRNHRDAKIMARTLREELARRQATLSHGECLDIVARQFGLENWNVLAARLSEEERTLARALTLPRGWILSGSKLELYEAGVDRASTCRSGHPALIRFVEDDEASGAMDKGFATLMQSVAAEPYLGRRVSLTADLRTQDVMGAATLWLRVDGAAKRTLAFDNMEDRTVDGPLSGTQDWVPRHIVLDVPPQAQSLHFGFYLRGSGTAWACAFDLREASDDAEATESRGFHPGPVNLDFSDAGPQPGHEQRRGARRA